MKKFFVYLLGLLLLGTSAQGQANLTFSGGSGSPFTLTLTQPVTYTVLTSAGTSPIFLFDGVGNVFGGGGDAVTGSITYTINGGSPQTINLMASGVTAGSIAPDDLYFYGAFLGVTAGDVVILNAGSVTTNGNVAGAAPLGGAYNTFIIDGSNGNQVSGPGTAVPEPEAIALAVFGGIVALLVSRKRRAR